MSKRVSLAIVTAGFVLLSSVPDSRAQVDEDVVRCRVSVLRAAGTYAKNELTTVQKCADRRAAGTVAGATDCTDPLQAHTAMGTVAPSSVFSSDPGAAGGICEAVPPSAAYYGACPAPCEAVVVSDWNGVSDCMKCVLSDVVGAYADDVIGNALLPAASKERSCLKSASASGARIVGAMQRANEKCQKQGTLPSYCEHVDDKGRAKLRKARAQASTTLATTCAESDFARIGGCASSLTNVGCVVANAERHGRDLIHAISRLLAPSPDSPATDFTQVSEIYPGGVFCALRSDASVMCWGGSALEVPGRFADLSWGCWHKPDGTPDCLVDRNTPSAIPPSGTFTLVDRTCGLRADGTIECWGDVVQPTDAGPFTQFSSSNDEICAVRSDGSVTCWTSHWNIGAVQYDRAGPFTSVSTGAGFNCGLRTDGSIECWVRDVPGSYFPTWAEAPVGTFTQVSVGANYACAVKTDATLACWGSDEYGKATPPAGTFTSMTAGYYSACGIRTDGSLDCWGNNGGSVASVPGDSALSLSSDGRCALRSDSSVDCWGDGLPGPAAAPSGSFLDITAGITSACGIVAADQSIQCWGQDVVPAPSGTYVDVVPNDSNSYDTCALRADGTIVCWSYYYDYTAPYSPSGTFVALADGHGGARCAIKSDGTLLCATSNHNAPADWEPVLPGTFTQAAHGSGLGCGVRTSGAVDCWKDAYYYETGTLPAGTYSQVGVAAFFLCGLQTDASIACVGRGAAVPPTAPSGTFVQLSLGSYHACAVRSDGTLACWGDDTYGEATPPSGTFTKVEAGHNYTCGLRPDSSVECWGGTDRGQTSPPAETFVEVESSYSNACGLLGDGTLRCWGVNYDPYTPNVLPPPSGTFSSLSLTDDLACAVRSDASIECWGATLPTPPIGTFTQVAAAGEYYFSYYYNYYPPPPHACALRSDGTVACWGDDSEGQSTPKFGTYQQISAARGKTCGVLTSGGLACWGDSYARSRPPAGSFVKVAASTMFACALRVDGTIHCWGNDGNGQSTPPADLFADVYVADSHACGIRPDSTVACWGSLLRP